MKTNFSLLFYLKKPKNYLKGAVPVYLRITVDGKRVEMSASRKCEPELWNISSGTIYTCFMAVCSPFLAQSSVKTIQIS
ncbi:Arm DNA-binding domain-containing protein [Pedobacter sp. WC2501]|uniref:Arm DNA-binding domain-containing protein n=1 Tax=Pedobacter sp. WC2501 TaxID=3461400 RepID=UPI004045994E